eukprot:10890738-Alexandrium_andersonii.AAC.1
MGGGRRPRRPRRPRLCRRLECRLERASSVCLRKDRCLSSSAPLWQRMPWRSKTLFLASVLCTPLTPPPCSVDACGRAKGGSTPR